MGLKYTFEIEDNGSARILRQVERDTESLGKATEQAGNKYRKLGAETKYSTSCIREMNDSMKRLQQLGFAAIVVNATSRVMDFGKAALEKAESVGKLAQSVGITTESMAGLQFVAQQSEIDLGGLTKVMKEITQSLSEASSGTGESARLFKGLGIEINGANGQLKTADQVLFELADKFSGAANGTEKAALAQKMFSKQWADVLPLLEQGGSALRKAVQEGSALSGITSKSAELADKFGDSLDTIGTIFQGAFLSAMTTLNPVVEAFGRGAQNALEWANHTRLLGEISQQNERGELRLALAQTNRLREAQRAGAKLSDNQIEFLSREEKNISSMREKLGLSDSAIELETKLAALAAMERIHREGGALALGLNLERMKKLRGEVEAMQAAQAKPTKGSLPLATAPASTQRKDPVAELEAQTMELLASLQTETGRIQSQYSALLTKIESLDTAHFDRLKTDLDVWYEYAISKSQAEEEKIATQKVLAESEAYERSWQNAQESLQKRVELYNEFYRTEEQKEKNAVRVKGQAYLEAGIAQIDVVKWREEQIQTITDRYRIEAERKDQEAIQKRVAVVNDALGKIAEYAGKSNQVLANFNEAEANQVADQFDKRKLEVQEHYQAQIAAAEGSEARQEMLRKKLADEEAKIETAKENKLSQVRKKYATERKVLLVAEATALGAKALLALWADATLPTLAKIPMAAIETALWASQVALIKSQKFELGGFPQGRNALVTVNERGQESILNAGATSRFSDFVVAANNGATRAEIAELIGGSKQPSQINLYLTGILNESFVRDSLVPALDKYARRR